MREARRDAPAHKLFDTVTAKRSANVKVPRAFAGYSVALDQANVPEGAEVMEMF